MAIALLYTLEYKKISLQHAVNSVRTSRGFDVCTNVDFQRCLNKKELEWVSIRTQYYPGRELLRKKGEDRHEVRKLRQRQIFEHLVAVFTLLPPQLPPKKLWRTTEMFDRVPTVQYRYTVLYTPIIQYRGDSKIGQVRMALPGEHGFLIF